MLRKDLVLVTLMVSILMLMVVPLNQQIIDILLAINISISVLLLMVSIYLKHPSDFSTFPSVILIGTAFRLALSIGTTRLILTEADAGQIIETFGDFVVGGSVAIGLVIFLIITVVQFLVVTKGAERVAEVGARFALDALPGKQMSIDADIRSGNLDQEVGTAMRKRLDKDSQFFGAMDGAMKFVKGDAIAGLIIIVINLIGGVAVGVSLHSYSLGEAVSIYSLLTVGDGLVAQIPALLMSLCAGVIVTRVANHDNDDLGSDISKELIADPRVPGVASFVVFGMGLIPGFPFWVFSGAAAALLITSYVLRRTYAEADRVKAEEEAAASENADDETSARPGEERTGEAAAEGQPGDLRSARFRVCVGKGLAKQMAPELIRQHSDMLFQKLKRTSGVNFPSAPVDMSEHIPAWDFVVELDEVPIFRETIPSNAILIDCGPEILPLLNCPEDDMTPVNWPTIEANWIPDTFEDLARQIGCDVLPPEQKLAEAAFRIYEQNLGSLFSRIEFDALLEQARKVDPEALTHLEQNLSRPVLFQIIRYLIEDGVPVRPMNLLIDSMQYWTQVNEGAGPVLISECLRGSMKRQLCHAITGEDNVLGVAMLDPELEAMARQSVTDAKRSGNLASLDGLVLSNEITESLVNQFKALTTAQHSDGRQLAVITTTDIRRRLRNFLAANDIHLPVLAMHEVSSDVTTYPIELVTLPNSAAAAARKAG